MSYEYSCLRGGLFPPALPEDLSFAPAPPAIEALASSIIGVAGSAVLNASFQRTLFLHGTSDITLHAARGDPTMSELVRRFSCRDKYGLKRLRKRLDEISPRPALASTSASSQQQFHRADNRLRRSRLIVDVGSGLGDFAIAAYKKDPALRIVALEPKPQMYTFLRWNLVSNRVPLLSEDAFFNRDGGGDGEGGVAARGGGVLALNMGVTSDGRNVSVESSGADRRAVGSLNLGVWLIERGVHQLDFLKVDCAGCEHELVASLEATLLQKTLAFEGEVPTCSFRLDHGCHYEVPYDRTLRELCVGFPTVNESRTLHFPVGRCMLHVPVADTSQLDTSWS